jgi:hypothetical protein
MDYPKGPNNISPHILLSNASPQTHNAYHVNFGEKHKVTARVSMILQWHNIIKVTSKYIVLKPNGLS